MPRLDQHNANGLCICIPNGNQCITRTIRVWPILQAANTYSNLRETIRSLPSLDGPKSHATQFQVSCLMRDIGNTSVRLNSIEENGMPRQPLANAYGVESIGWSSQLIDGVMPDNKVFTLHEEKTRMRSSKVSGTMSLFLKTVNGNLCCIVFPTPSRPFHENT